jgi:hypothetical protein
MEQLQMLARASSVTTTKRNAFWLVRWDLGGRPPFQQEVLPYPCVNVAFEDGRFKVHGSSYLDARILYTERRRLAVVPSR